MEQSRINEIKEAARKVFDIFDFDLEKEAAKTVRKISLNTYEAEKHLIAAAKRLNEQHYELVAHHLLLCVNWLKRNLSLKDAFDSAEAFESAMNVMHTMKSIVDTDFNQIVDSSKETVAESFWSKDLYSISKNELADVVDLGEISMLIDEQVQGNLIHSYVVDGDIDSTKNIDLSKVRWLKNIVASNDLTNTIKQLSAKKREPGVTQIVPILQLNQKIKLYSFFIVAIITEDAIVFISDNEDFANPYAAQTTRSPYRRRQDNFEKLLYPYYLLDEEEYQKYSTLPVANDNDYAVFQIPINEIEPVCTIFMQLLVSIYIDLMTKNVVQPEKASTLEQHLNVLTLPAPTGLSNSSHYSDDNEELYKYDGVAKHIKELEESLLDNQDCNSLVVYSKEIVTKGVNYDGNALITAKRAKEYLEFYARDEKRKQIQELLNKYNESTSHRYFKKLDIEVRQFMRDQIELNIDKLIEYAYAGEKNTNIELPKGIRDVSFCAEKRITKKSVTVDFSDGVGSTESTTYYSFILNEFYKVCHFEPEKTATRTIAIRFHHWKQFLQLFGVDRKDIPLSLRNYKSRPFIPYAGNTMLSDVDPIMRIVDPASKKWRNGIVVCIQLNGRLSNKFKKKHTKYKNAIVTLDGNILDHDDQSVIDQYKAMFIR